MRIREINIIHQEAGEFLRMIEHFYSIGHTGMGKIMMFKSGQISMPVFS